MILSGIKYYSRFFIWLLLFTVPVLCLHAQKKVTEIKSSTELKEGTNEVPFIKVERESGMKGGIRALRQYLDSNFSFAALSQQWPAADTVVNDSLFVRLIINTKGILLSFDGSDTTSAFFGEVKRVLKKSEPWMPAEQCGVFVKSYTYFIFYFRRQNGKESVWVRPATSDQVKRFLPKLN